MLNLSRRLTLHPWSCVLAGYRYGDAIPNQLPISSLELKSKRLARLDKATILDRLASRAVVKIANGVLYIQ